MLKVGLELFAAEGPSAVRAAAALGRPVFLDLKLHDIPNTVEGAARSAAACGASLLTVHASGGAEMVRAAVRGAGGKLRVLAVTVLTSLDADALARSASRGRPRRRWCGSRGSPWAPARAGSSARRTRSGRCARRSGRARSSSSRACGPQARRRAIRRASRRPRRRSRLARTSSSSGGLCGTRRIRSRRREEIAATL